MIYGEKWKIYWDCFMKNAYFYGTEISFKDKDHIEIHNNIVPSGTVIKEWFSKVNFQASRTEPTLPIIDGEGKYEISFDLKTDIDEGVLFRIMYYDKYDNEVGHQTIKSSGTVFTCPMATYSYRIQMINMGAKDIVFHSMSIQEVMDESEE